jgi:CheY-like chemotaxis protein
MLVVTRRPSQKITFPTLGITVHFLETSGKNVKVGIDAPREVQVFRDEVVLVGPSAPPPKKPDHALANAISRVTLAIHLARKQWQVGLTEEADRTLDLALKGLESFGESGPAAAPARPRRRVLIVDDDANERELLAGLLGMNGCDCAIATDGADALERLAAGGRPDVVLLDMAMPRCDGPETLRRIRADARFSALPVFSVSSTNPRDLNIPEGRGGFDGWFPKPLNPTRLWEAIQAAGPPTVSEG